MLGDHNPFAAIIVNYVDFRERLVGRKPKNEQSSAVNVMLSAGFTNANKSRTCLISWADKDQLPADVPGTYLQVEERDGEDICHVKIIHAGTFMDRENVELEDITLNVVFLPAYLNRFYDFLTTGVWE